MSLCLSLFDYSEEESNDRSKFHKYRRHRRLGYPPVTPNACAKDTVVSQLFDQIWGEVRFFVYLSVHPIRESSLWAQTPPESKDRGLNCCS